MPKNKNVLLYTSEIFKKPVKLQLFVGSYQDSRSLYVGLLTAKDGEGFMDLTVNVDESTMLTSYQAAVKNYEIDGVEKFITDNGLGIHTGIEFRAGYVMVPVYQFDKEKLIEFSVNGVDDYEARRILSD